MAKKQKPAKSAKMLKAPLKTVAKAKGKGKKK